MVITVSIEPARQGRKTARTESWQILGPGVIFGYKVTSCGESPKQLLTRSLKIGDFPLGVSHPGAVGAKRDNATEAPFARPSEVIRTRGVDSIPRDHVPYFGHTGGANKRQVF